MPKTTAVVAQTKKHAVLLRLISPLDYLSFYDELDIDRGYLAKKDFLAPSPADQLPS